jgi:hypothetical protein
MREFRVCLPDTKAQTCGSPVQALSRPDSGRQEARRGQRALSRASF